jgi:hypothetical protein
MDEHAEERVARLEKAVSRCLALLDAGEVAEVRRELAALVKPAEEPAPALPVTAEFSGPMSDNELDRAFAEAESQADEMVSANRVAEIAMEQADRALVGQLGPDELGSSFATESMAELLEQQGDVEGARRIRASLAQPAAANETGAAPSAEGTGSSARPGRQQVVATLERWLQNLRGAHA